MAELTLRDAADVTNELLLMAVSITDGWYRDRPIEWDDVWDRMDGEVLSDGRTLVIPELVSPAQTKIQRYVRDLRKKG